MIFHTRTPRGKWKHLVPAGLLTVMLLFILAANHLATGLCWRKVLSDGTSIVGGTLATWVLAGFVVALIPACYYQFFVMMKNLPCLGSTGEQGESGQTIEPSLADPGQLSPRSLAVIGITIATLLLLLFALYCLFD